MMIFGDFSKPKFNEMVAAGQVNKGKGGGVGNGKTNEKGIVVWVFVEKFETLPNCRLRRHLPFVQIKKN